MFRIDFVGRQVLHTRYLNSVHLENLPLRRTLFFCFVITSTKILFILIALTGPFVLLWTDNAYQLIFHGLRHRNPCDPSKIWLWATYMPLHTPQATAFSHGPALPMMQDPIVSFSTRELFVRNHTSCFGITFVGLRFPARRALC